MFVTLGRYLRDASNFIYVETLKARFKPVSLMRLSKPKSTEPVVLDSMEEPAALSEVTVEGLMEKHNIPPARLGSANRELLLDALEKQRYEFLHTAWVFDIVLPAKAQAEPDDTWRCL